MAGVPFAGKEWVHMTIGFAIFYGILQGLTEFLPVSSSGHLALLQSLTGADFSDGTYFSFDILLHLATLLAVCAVYRKELCGLIPACLTAPGALWRGKGRLSLCTERERTVLLLLLATLPLGLGIFVKDLLEPLYACPRLIGAVLLLNGAMLLLSDCAAHRRRGKPKTAADAGPLQALAVGFCQLCALLPGLSRSGTTITGGLLCGFDRAFAVKFSFLLSIPAILGANIMNLGELCRDPLPQEAILPCLCGMLAAALTGILAMKLLIRISGKGGFWGFGLYCAAAGCFAVSFFR